LAHPDVDIVNLTKEQALDIYKRDYWDAINGDSLPWPLCLAVFDLSVNGGVGRAQQALAEAGQDFDRYNAWRLRWYTSLDQFDLYGPAWVRRVATILEASKA
jgi:lysozyme family protein